MMQRNYRSDIDGLRAIAVLSVFLHHLNASLLPGGFIGVDIFFVISGFLITGQISQEIQSGTFSIRQFYQRRINRIVPALVTVVAVSLVAGIFLLSPADLLLMMQSATYAIFGISNIFFWREYGNYFGANSAEAPLLHTWSLGVEEQYYVIWPLLLLLLFRTSRGHRASMLFLLLVIALVVSEAGTRIAASASYYLLPSRFFELMIGGLLALLACRIPPSSSTQSLVAFLAGLALVIGSLFWTDSSLPFPGIQALWPCVGTALLIWSGIRPGAWTSALTIRPMVFIGLVSYSLYLWHWPLIAYLRYLGVSIDLVVGASVAGAALLLSWLSWKFVETPLRRSGSALPFLSVFAKRFVMPAVALLSLSVAAEHSQGLPGRFDPEVARLEEALQSKPNELRSGCHVPTVLYDTPPMDKCRLGVNKSLPDGILIGDSFANHFTGMLDILAKHDGLSLIDYTMDGCPPIAGYDNGKIPAYAERCQLRNKAAYEYIENKRYRLVVLASNWPETENAGNFLQESIKRLQATGAQIYIILKNEPIKDASTCVIRNEMYGLARACDQAPSGQPGYLKNIQQQFPSVRFIDPNVVICESHRCNAILDGNLIYRDSAHLNDIGSRKLGERLLAAGIRLEITPKVDNSTR